MCKQDIKVFNGWECSQLLVYLRIDQLDSLEGTLNPVLKFTNLGNIEHTNNNKGSQVLVFLMVELVKTNEEDAEADEENANRNNENDQFPKGKRW